MFRGGCTVDYVPWGMYHALEDMAVLCRPCRARGGCFGVFFCHGFLRIFTDFHGYFLFYFLFVVNICVGVFFGVFFLGCFFGCSYRMYHALADMAVLWRPCRAKGFSGLLEDRFFIGDFWVV